ncbi:helix-turn-helix domain-containing protein [Bradyrhizobium elkanii]|uniref:helix-turn-helix domain-containing protein n=1 Tax=Bradyrhizobium elkanii TaxID=29448 RepID=UPI00056FBB34|nr:helix-turn-helix transcriptional regulator [Bradyrhizobium elkanii]WLA83247.1 helix-turn-helix transcriptional regulator [Bradyrhizobium elkanii]
MDEILTPALIRAARGLLGIDQAEVAKRAGLNQRTISKLEGETEISNKDLRRRKVLTAIREAFEKDGIEFIFPSPTSGPGVRMRAPGQPAD